jgi:hypothetical protein
MKCRGFRQRARQQKQYQHENADGTADELGNSPPMNIASGMKGLRLFEKEAPHPSEKGLGHLLHFHAATFGRVK